MRQTMEFTLPEEQEEFETYLNAFKYHSVLWEFAQVLRSMTKHNGHPTESRLLTDVEIALAEQLREKFYELVQAENLTDL